ncbi:MAG TPA: hypothetical protein VGS97_24090 [Actinocrinis sp.]|uniref:hypothetical protein n=1 Tax=Actinocrinis sp. TaxID=1920516 RepID=UPI002DDCC396|nr:hypothetical protein [Actinocrinis sp.]HEV2347199.1 hypothetical protein [Actinocrinis sp.]
MTLAAGERATTTEDERLPVPGTTRWAWLREGLWATLPAWLAARVLVGGMSWYLDRAHPLGKLFMWDTEWYLLIAKQGYDRPGILIHFFPATSLGAAGLATITRLPTSIALFAFCWMFALLFGALVHRAVVRETGDHGAARRAAWLTQLAPGAFALVMGYTEPLAGALAVGYFLALRGSSPGQTSRLTASRTWTAAALGFLSGMARPIGVLLAVPGAVEGLRDARRADWSRSAVARAAVAAAAPAAGLATFLAYSRVRYGSWLLPYTQQTAKLDRGGIMGNPLGILRHVWRHDPRHHGHEVATMAVILIVCFVALLPTLLRRLPISYAAWTVPSLLLAVGSKDFTSLPRYLGALFPCLMAAALVTRRRRQWAAVLALSSTLLLWTTYLVFKDYTVA